MKMTSGEKNCATGDLACASYVADNKHATAWAYIEQSAKAAKCGSVRKGENLEAKIENGKE